MRKQGVISSLEMAAIFPWQRTGNLEVYVSTKGFDLYSLVPPLFKEKETEQRDRRNKFVPELSSLQETPVTETKLRLCIQMKMMDGD